MPDRETTASVSESENPAIPSPTRGRHRRGPQARAHARRSACRTRVRRGTLVPFATFYLLPLWGYLGLKWLTTRRYL
jgi:hypothetical protein